MNAHWCLNKKQLVLEYTAQ